MDTHQSLSLITCLLFPCINRIAGGKLDLEPSRGNAILGGQFNFTVRVSNVTSGLVIFKRNVSANICSRDISTGKQVINVTGYDCGVNKKDKSLFLEIYHVSLEDAGSWFCQFAGMKSNTAKLNVKYSPTVRIQPVVSCTSFTYSVNEKNVSLNCNVISANPVPSTFQWYHNNQSLSKRQTLVIPSVNRSSGGLYRCSANNGVSPPGVDTVTVNVHYPPKVTVPKTTIIVNESRDLNITCTADANPSVTSIVWTKKGVVPYAQLPATNGVLLQRNLTKNHTGTFICTATNTVTQCDNTTENQRGTAMVQVGVQYKPTITSFRISSQEDQKSVIVKENTNVTFLCQVDSLPGADITIWKEGEKMNNTQNDSSLSFVLGSVGCHVIGNYTCSARNILGEAESDTLELLVKCSPRLLNSYPREVILTAVKNGNTTFNFTVQAYPEPSFTLGENALGLKHNISSTLDGFVTTGTLAFFNIQQNQFKCYILRVNNTEGRLDLNITLRAESKPESPLNLEVYNPNTRSLSISWEKGFNGGAIQNFTVEYRQEGGHWITHPIMLSEEENLQLDIHDLQPDTPYEIRLKAQNKYGSSPLVFVHARTISDSRYGLYGGIAAVGVVVVAIIVVVVVVRAIKKEDEKAIKPSRNEVTENERAVMEDNVLYEASEDLMSRSGQEGNNTGDVYAVVQKPGKDLVMEDNVLYEASGNLPSTSGNNTGDVYAVVKKPEKNKELVGADNAEPKKKKKKGKDVTKKPKKSKGSNDVCSQGPEEVYVNRGASAADPKPVPKTGRDDDGLLYVSVDFDDQPKSNIIIGADEAGSQYAAVDFSAKHGSTQ